MNDLGMVYLHFGQNKQAEKEFAKAAAIQIRSKKAHPMDVVVRRLGILTTERVLIQ